MGLRLDSVVSAPVIRYGLLFCVIKIPNVNKSRSHVVSFIKVNGGLYTGIIHGFYIVSTEYEIFPSFSFTPQTYNINK